jgi:hypothetical protein
LAGDLSFLTQFAPLVLSLIAVLISFYTFQAQRKESSYADIDQNYYQILELAIRYPALRDQRQISTYFTLPPNDPFRIQYESYAYICMNLAETIYDRQTDRRGRFGLSATWFPVVVEESRLHIHWFCRNLGLFKERFQVFIMHDLNKLHVSEGSIKDLDEIYPRMERDFPATELKSRSQIERLMARGEYKLYLARHETLPILFGYALMFEPKSPRIGWLDYLAIDEQYRNAGFGTAFFNKLCEISMRQRRGIILEVEPPTSDDPETLQNQHRRIAFYTRIGAQQLAVEYLFPSSAGSYPLLLFYRSIAKADVLHKESIKAIIKAAYAYIHDDVPDRADILARFIDNVRDNPL